jgi:hypothetical protein
LSARDRTQRADGLLLILEDAVDVLFSQFDCRGSTCPSYTSFAFAVAEIDFPPPSGVIQQLNDGKVHSFIFHEIFTSHNLCGGHVCLLTGLHKPTLPYVHLCTYACNTGYYTGNFRCWCARPLIAVASLCPAITRTPSSIRAITLSSLQPCRKATPLLRQAARMRSRAACISGG